MTQPPELDWFWRCPLPESLTATPDLNRALESDSAC